MCDTEFTIEQGKLWMLQTRVGKRTGRAALRMAVDMVGERAIRLTKAEAVQRVTGEHLDQVLHPQFAGSGHTVLAQGPRGLARAPPSGRVYLTADDAEAAAERGEKVVLVRSETSPEDVHGMLAAEGILTARGGLVSHAAVVARGWGKPAVVGAESRAHRRRIPSRWGTPWSTKGDWISIDGTTGTVVLGQVPVTEGADRRRSSTPSSAGPTRSGPAHWACGPTPTTGPTPPTPAGFGAEGIGLCRTEHMFLAEDRLPIVRRMILAVDARGGGRRLEELRVAQQADFVEILEAMDGLPVTVRLLDPPLHEFLPDIEELAVKEATTGLSAEEQQPLRGGPGLARVQPDARHPRGAPRA